MGGLDQRDLKLNKFRDFRYRKGDLYDIQTFRFVSIIAICLTALPMTATSAALMLAHQAAEIVSMRNVTVKDGEVADEVVNNSKQRLRDVQLQILYS